MRPQSLTLSTPDRRLSSGPRALQWPPSGTFAGRDGATGGRGTGDSGQLAAMGTLHKLRAGETLFMEGDVAPNCYQVLTGLMKEFNTLNDGACHISGFCFPGQLVGLSFTGVYQHTVEAIEETALISYPAHRFHETVAESPGLSRWLAHLLAADLERARTNALAISRLNAMERVARFLLMLARAAGPGHGPGGAFTIPMSRQDIADHLGLTIETVCRCLSTLKRNRLIEMETAHGYTIPDEHALAAVAGREDTGVR